MQSGSGAGKSGCTALPEVECTSVDMRHVEQWCWQTGVTPLDDLRQGTGMLELMRTST